MYVEYDWTFNVFHFRLGQTFTDWRGFRYVDTIEEVKALLAQAGCRLGEKTDSRTWPIVCAEKAEESRN